MKRHMILAGLLSAFALCGFAQETQTTTTQQTAKSSDSDRILKSLYVRYGANEFSKSDADFPSYTIGLKGYRLHKDNFYVSFGAELSYFNEKEDGIKSYLWEVAVPFEFGYAFDAGSCKIVPLAGYGFSYNISGGSEYKGGDIDFFDDKDMGTGNTWSHFHPLFPLKVGVHVITQSGFEVGCDYIWNDAPRKGHLGGFNFTLGIRLK